MLACSLLSLVGLAVTISIPSFVDGEALYVLSAPNLLRVGCTENIFVESQDHTGGPLNVDILVKKFPTQEHLLAIKSVVLDAANNFQSLTQVVIPAKELLVEDPEKKQFVVLQARFPDRLLEKTVLVSFQCGYIFIQTDKTIYTPASTVSYRLFSMNPGLETLSTAIIVEITNPDNIPIHKKSIYINQGVNSEEFKLPEMVNFGTWHVVARFKSNPEKTFSSDFEVKGYVLPSFEVILTPAKPFYNIEDKDLTVSITAKYRHGVNVIGAGYVVFGVITVLNEKKSIPSSLQKVEIREGKGVARLHKDHITQTFTDIKRLVKQFIYVSISVLSEGGGEMVDAEIRGVQIVTSPYTILFTKTPHFFKPGMHFDVSVHVVYPDKSPASGVEIELSPNNVRRVTRENGIAKVTINTLPSATELLITVKTKDLALPPTGQAEASMKVLAYRTSTKNLLHIWVESDEVKIGDTIKIYFTMGSLPLQNQELTYLLLSRGQLVKVGRVKTQGHSLVLLTVLITKEMLPSLRIVAYYHVGTADLVADSVWVHVKDSCRSIFKVRMTRPKASYGPGNSVSLTLSGDPGAKVGLVAVDKGVYTLNNNHRLTQNKIWDTIEKLDTGCTVGGGADSLSVFYDAGLIIETNAGFGTQIRTDPSCPYKGRQRRAVMSEEPGSLNVFTTRANKNTDFQNQTSSIRHDFQHDTPLLSDSNDQRAKDGFIDLEDIYTHSNFLESWFWMEIMLPKCPAYDKHCRSTSSERAIFLKDSLTTWQITAISLSQTQGICVSEPFEIIVQDTFFIDLMLPYSAVRNKQLVVKAILHNYSEESIAVQVDLMVDDTVCSSASKGSYRQEVNMASMSTLVVPYVLIPMTLGEVSVVVKASRKDHYSSYGLKRHFLVLPEGVLVREANLILLKPDKHGGAQTEHIRSAVYRDQVPNSHADTLISVKKDDLEDNEIMIKVVARPSVISWQITKENQFRNYQIRYFDKSMTVTASGKGEVSMIVERWYYALPEKKESDCENLDFSITFTKMDRPSHQDAEESFMLNIDVLYHKERDATILILDIGLLNGFIVDTDDLKMLAIERGCSIERFEMGRVLSERGSLIIHLDKVSHKVADKISFKVHRVMNVRDLQPAAISVCEFQNKTPCVKFYRPQRGGTLNTVCFEDSLCTCAEERCSVQKNDVSEKERMDNVRELSTDYVYKATVVDMNLTTQTDTYTMSIAQVLKAGKDEKVMKGTKVVFMGLPYCREALGLKVGQTYIIMGESRDTHLVRENDLLLYKYFLGEKTWIEHWPTVSDCLSRGSKVCQEIEKLRHQIVTFGYGV